MRNYCTVDVFTDVPFAGNPLAVVEDAQGLDEQQMQFIAAEFGYSETVFVFPAEHRGNTAKIRIFTPTMELPFAGHPTVGAAAILSAGQSRVRLEERIGIVEVDVLHDRGDAIYAELTAPQLPTMGPPAPPVTALAAVLGLADNEIAGPAQCFSAGVPFVFAELKDANSLGGINFHVDLWDIHLSGHWAPQLYAFHASPTPEGVAVAARMFSPAFGVLEDTGTGAAAVALAGVLTHRDNAPRAGVLHYSITQGVELGRISRLHGATKICDGQPQEVRVGGYVVPMSRGALIHDTPSS